jgi:hypothetical protein
MTEFKLMLCDNKPAISIKLAGIYSFYDTDGPSEIMSNEGKKMKGCSYLTFKSAGDTILLCNKMVKKIHSNVIILDTERMRIKDDKILFGDTFYTYINDNTYLYSTCCDFTYECKDILNILIEHFAQMIFK